MVASRHSNSRPSGARTPDRQIGLRPPSSRLQTRPIVGGCREQRPPLRLVVDNTACGAGSAARSGLIRHRGVPDREAGEPGSIATELGAWLKASVRLAEARWRLARQRWINRHGHFGMTGRVAGLGPVVGLVAVVLFGGLFGLRLAQESSGSTAGVEGVAGSIAAVATSTSGAEGSSHVPASVGPGSVVVVHPGDSLWSIAVSRYPGHDPRAVVDAFVEANGASTIRPGQQLIVPAALIEG